MNYRKLATTAFGLLLVATAAQAEHPAVLGDSGELFSVRTASYRELFPNGAASEPGHPVISLGIVRPDGTSERLLVPGTGGPEVESTPFLLYERDTDTVFLVWESRINSLHSVLRLVSYNGTDWSEPIEIIGSLFSSKHAPRLAVTRDSDRTATAEGESRIRHRTVLHLIWTEDKGPGQAATLYSPVVLEDGAYIGWNPIFDLHEFLPSSEPVTSFDPSTELVRSPALQSGHDGRTVVASFVSTSNHQLVTVGIDVLPQELLSLADIARAIIINIGARLGYPSSIDAIAAQTRAALVREGSAFHPEVVSSMADQVTRSLLDDLGEESDLQNAADRARAIIINIGRKLASRGLKEPNLSRANDFLVEMPEQLDGPESSRTHALQVQVLSTRPAPRIGEGPVQVFVSESGADVLIAWAAEDRVFYRETQEQGWSPIKELRLSSELTQDGAYQVLEQRVRNR